MYVYVYVLDFKRGIFLIGMLSVLDSKINLCHVLLKIPNREQPSYQSDAPFKIYLKQGLNT